MTVAHQRSPMRCESRGKEGIGAWKDPGRGRDLGKMIGQPWNNAAALMSVMMTP
jgi:hypothetical protein